MPVTAGGITEESLDLIVIYHIINQPDAAAKWQIHTRTHTPQHAADYEPTRTNTSHKNPKQQQPRMSPEYFRPSAKPVGESVQVCVCACVLVSMADSSLPPPQMSCWNHPSLSFVLHRQTTNVNTHNINSSSQNTCSFHQVFHAPL